MCYLESHIEISSYGQLVNRFNDKDLEVETEFEIGNDKYTIMRGYKPAKFKLTKNGKELNILSAKKLNQEEIDKLLRYQLCLVQEYCGSCFYLQ